MQGRNFGLDLLRSILMLIGVLIHASTVMSPYGKWSYSSTMKLDDILYALVYATHFFRMEAFFLVAGFFSLLVIARKSEEFYFKNRIKRVLIPLVFSMLTISPLVIYLSVIYSDLNISNISIGNIVIHFWFLLTLMVLSALTFGGFLDKIIKKLEKMQDLKIVVCLVMVGFINLLINLAVIKFDPTQSGYLKQIYQLLITNTVYYGMFYILGCAFYENIEMINRSKLKFLHMIICLAVYSTLLLVIREEMFSGYYMKAIKLIYYSTLVIPAYISSVFLFKKFSELKIKESKLVKTLVDSSIIIYLFHVPALIFISKMFDRQIHNPYLYYISICLATYAMTFIIYFLIKSNRYTRFVYGLK